MNAFEYIDPSIPYLKSTDSVQKGREWLDEYKLFNLPVVDNKTKQYLGLVAEEMLLSTNIDDSIADILLHSQDKKIGVDAHIYEALAIIDSGDLDIVPVVDKENTYVGLLTSKELLHCIAQLTSVTDHGGVIDLLMNSYDYSLVEISRAVESNGAKILSSYVSSVPGASEKTRVSIKLNISDVSLVVAEFQQLNYTITSIHTEFETVDNTLDNYRHLFKYLDL
jgi:acetoin utilization protein AcuB